LWLKMLNASDVLPANDKKRKEAGATFFFQHLMPKVAYYKQSIEAGYDQLFGLEDELI